MYNHERCNTNSVDEIETINFNNEIHVNKNLYIWRIIKVPIHLSKRKHITHIWKQ